MSKLKRMIAEADRGPKTVQIGAVCYRMREGKVEYLQITSRETRRWIIPKGWPMKGKKPFTAAAIEAWEEAGVIGEIGKKPIGQYRYTKRLEGGEQRHVTVIVFPLLVSEQSDEFPERGQRRRKWRKAKKAAKKVWEPELAKLLKKFAKKKAAELRRSDERLANDAVPS